jgi:hypothetical protein
MASWRSFFSYACRGLSESRLINQGLPGIALALLASACGHAGDNGRPTAVPADAKETMPSAQQALCVPADEGRLRARLSGAIDAEIDWSPPTPQCLGSLRPDGEGVRLIYKGDIPGQGPLLVVIGIGPLRAGENARNVPANLTLVREGAGLFYATQGDDKCAVDDVKQEPIGEDGHRFLLTGRGYCTQPARAVGGDGLVLVPRFDLSAVVEFQ